jgi:hypothetical protein
VQQETKVLRPRLSWRIVPLERRVERRFELARIAVADPHVITIRRVWQLLSHATAAEGQSGRIDDPGLIEALETAGRVRIRWHLVRQDFASFSDASGFPEDGPLRQPTPQAPLEGWVSAPLMYPWGDASERQIPVGPSQVLRLYLDVEQRDGTLTSVGGLLEGQSEHPELSSAETQRRPRSGKGPADRANDCFLAVARSLDSFTHYVGSEVWRGVSDARQIISGSKRREDSGSCTNGSDDAPIGMLTAACDAEAQPLGPSVPEPATRTWMEGTRK